jgi:hypothetical protein
MTSVSIPAFQVSNKRLATGEGTIFIASRAAPTFAGTFSVNIAVQFDPAADLYPAGTLSLTVDMNDGAKGVFKSTTIEVINAYGKVSPTIYVSGQCSANCVPIAKGCRYWLLISNNKQAGAQGTPDVVGFAIHDRDGNLVAYGTGPVKNGAFKVF